MPRGKLQQCVCKHWMQLTLQQKIHFLNITRRDMGERDTELPVDIIINNIVGMRSKLMACMDTIRQQRKRLTKQRVPELDDQLSAWVRQREASNVILSDSFSCIKAKMILKALGKPDALRLSNGWLQQFKSRHRIRSICLHGEAARVDRKACEKAMNALSLATTEYALNDFFNCDEAGFRSRQPTAIRREKDSSDYHFCNKRYGKTERLPPYFIGRSPKPQRFDSRSPKELGYKYDNNSSSWMKWPLSKARLQRINANMQSQNRSILLLLDNASVHKPSKTAAQPELSNVKLQFLPPNTTSRLQPHDAGVIASVKARFKRKLIEDGFFRSEEGEEELYSVDLRQTMA
ncbi:TPA: hypothetical protein N0F65_010096 [Lagenidium giganteum]|uniref:HTH CENPB-type domain-containing protein n=1 Tax=Lagenidium giganteum TaxID=4803 RepID=A0AAV2YG31_9STRA|nr:TPA: hypothetical protein N0F65_010096 [Lagenidium giganteum]